MKLTDVCYKPFGDVCATQSVLQYWQMDRTVFKKEQVGVVSLGGQEGEGGGEQHRGAGERGV